MTIVAGTGTALYPTIQSNITGIGASTLGLTMYNATGTVRVGRTTSGFIELVAGSGFYLETASSYTAPAAAGVYQLSWDNNGTFLAAEELLVSTTVQYFDAATSATLSLSVDTKGLTGLAGAGLGLTLYDVTGAVVTARVTSPFLEAPAGSGFYYLTGSYTSPATAAKYIAVWDNAGTFLAGEDVYIGAVASGGGGGGGGTPTLTYAGFKLASSQTRYSYAQSTRYSSQAAGF